MDAASNGGKDEIRDLIERAAYKPSVGRFKVFMIDEAHQLTKDAFNALLKTLEEPPDYLKFVLATTDPEKMLPTVLSRCLQFNLRPMAPETVAEHLQQVLAAEGVAADAGALRLLSRAARGSMRDALSLTDQAIAFGGGTLAEDGVRAMLGTVDRSPCRGAGAGAGRARRRGGAGHRGRAARHGPVGRRHAGRDGDAAAADGGGAGGARCARRQRPRHRRRPPAGRGAAGRRDPAALQHRRARPGRAEPAGRRVRGADHGAAAPAGLRAGRRAAPAAAAAPRAAPLVATPREARSTAPARPVVLPTTVARPPAAAPVSRPAAPQAAAPAAVVRTASVAAAPAGKASWPAAAQAAPAPTVQEPPPWLDEGPPDELESARSSAGSDPGRPGPQDDAQDESQIESQDTFQGSRPQVQRARRPDPSPAAPARPAVAPVRPAASSLPPAEPLAPLPTSALGAQWAAVVRPLAAAGAVVALVRELAFQAELLAVTPAEGGGRRWQLRVERESLRNPALAARLAASMGAALGEPAEVDLVAGVAQESLARHDAHAREAAQREAEQTIHADPVVRALLAEFSSARIVPGSIKPLAADGGEQRQTYHDEEPTRRPDEAGPGDAGQPEEGPGRTASSTPW